MERFLTTIQLGFAICFLAWATSSAARCIITGTNAYGTICFAAMTATAWHFMVKPAWDEYKESRTKKKGDQQ